ncbi:MAG: sugar transferase [Hyphomonadaceae bacterium]|nr:sugar transferase [Hyphomonadaceae bacterium]
MPRGSEGQPKAESAEECSAFEAALRRDLASAPVISYDSVLGGWPKRAFDLLLTLLSAPLWAPVMLIAALSAKLQHPAPVFVSDEKIGYGGAPFRCLRLRLDPPSAVIERLRVPGAPEEAPAPANDWGKIAAQAEASHAKWRRALSALPRLINVLRGELSLVGPTPLDSAEVEALPGSRRYYLSARPGVVDVASVAEEGQERATQHKVYALSWSLGLDVLLLWDGLRSLRDRGELWKPRQASAAQSARRSEALARRRAQA